MTPSTFNRERATAIVNRILSDGKWHTAAELIRAIGGDRSRAGVFLTDSAYADRPLWQRYKPRGQRALYARLAHYARIGGSHVGARSGARTPHAGRKPSTNELAQPRTDEVTILFTPDEALKRRQLAAREHREEIRRAQATADLRQLEDRYRRGRVRPGHDAELYESMVRELRAVIDAPPFDERQRRGPGR